MHGIGVSSWIVAQGSSNLQCESTMRQAFIESVRQYLKTRVCEWYHCVCEDYDCIYKSVQHGASRCGADFGVIAADSCRECRVYLSYSISGV